MTEESGIALPQDNIEMGANSGKNCYNMIKAEVEKSAYSSRVSVEFDVDESVSCSALHSESRIWIMYLIALGAGFCFIGGIVCLVTLPPFNCPENCSREPCYYTDENGNQNGREFECTCSNDEYHYDGSTSKTCIDRRYGENDDMPQYEAGLALTIIGVCTGLFLLFLHCYFRATRLEANKLPMVEPRGIALRRTSSTVSADLSEIVVPDIPTIVVIAV